MTSSLEPIPDWDLGGRLPPFVGSPTSGNQRSPYLVGLTDMALRLGDTATRRKLLNGLLDYRANLHAADLRDGFQWVNGSFVENTEQRDHRAPNDIDVVTFMRLPRGQSQAGLAEANPSLFDQDANRNLYGVDTYTVVLDTHDPIFLVRVASYWNSVWSHDRRLQWKGYLEINLSGDEDAAARAVLQQAALTEEEG